MKKNVGKFSFLIIAILSVFLYTQVFANTASMDPSFYTGLPVGFNNTVYTLAEQNDGKIIVGGDFTTYKGIPANRIVRLYADGSIDNTFVAGDGFNNSVKKIIIQNDGKIIVGGGFTGYQGVAANKIIRLNADGSIDDTFIVGDGFNAVVSTIVIQNDGKIIAGGNFATYQGVGVNYIIRLNTDGSRDTSFDIGSGFGNIVSTITLQDDGKIIAGGSFTSYQGVAASKIIRLNTDGSRDTDFVMGDGFDSVVYTIAVQDDDKIVIGGSFTTYKGVAANKIIRLNTDGNRDTDFVMGNGFGSTVATIILQDDGKIIAGGSFTSYQSQRANRIARLNTNGSIDWSFVLGDNNSLFNSTVQILMLQNDDSFFAGGAFTTYRGAAASRIVHLDGNGDQDNTFVMGDGFDNYINVLATQDDGKIIVGGNFTSYNLLSANRLTRINTDGTRDNTLDVGVLGFSSAVLALAIQDDGKMIVGGGFVGYNGVSTQRIARINPDGTRDDDFSAGGGFSSQGVYAIAIQSGGKIVVGGSFTNYQGSAINRIIRLNTDGSRDTDFIVGDGFNSTVYTLAIQDDEKIIVGGNFTTYSGSTANRIIRLNADGSRDVDFDIGDGFNDTVSTIMLQDDGKIVAGGGFTTYSGSTANRIIRLNADGSRDVDFDIGDGFNQLVKTVGIQNDGKIIVGGSFTSYQGVTANRIVGLNADGSRDTTFVIGNGFDNNVNALMIQDDGKIVAGGAFLRYNGASTSYLTSLYGNSDLVILPDSTDRDVVVAEFTGKGYVKSNGDLIGSRSISLSETDGNIPISLSLKNEDIKLSMPADIQFKESDDVTDYDGVISVPIVKSINSVNDEEVISAFKVGGSSESLKLDGGVATLSFPVPDQTIGDIAQIYYSEDNGATWYLQETTTVTDNNGDPYISFDTDHFTDFAITSPDLTGSFVINDDDAATYSQSVTLNISTTPAAQYMRFSNDNETRSEWEEYAESVSWTLSDGYSQKTVYAELDIDGDENSDIATSDAISYEAELDVQAPVITLNGSANIEIEYGNNYIESGATWIDDVDGTGDVETIIGEVDTGTVGMYYIEYIRVDSSGNTGTATKTVEVVDTTAPIISDAFITPELVGTTAQVAILRTVSDLNSVDNTYATLVGPEGFGDNETVSLELFSGDDHTGIWSGIYTFVEGDPDGVYFISGCTTDTSNNTRCQEIGSITLDRGAPTTTSVISITPAYVGVENIVTINISAQDTILGINSITVKDSNTDISAEMTSGTSIPTVPGEIGSRTFSQAVTEDQGIHIEEISISDLVNNIYTATGSFVYDTIMPEGTLEYSTEELTNEDITAYISFEEEDITITNNSGADEYLFSENGVFTFEFRDLAGNTGEITAEVDWIDKNAPIAEIVYDPETSTDGNVIATLRSEEDIVITSEGGDTHTFTSNGSFVFEFEDELGNATEKIATVGWITVPTPPSGGGGGGGNILTKDKCPAVRDCSDSYYDSLCGPCSLVEKVIDKLPFHKSADKEPANIEDSPFSPEVNNAYLRSYEYDITSIPNINQANIYGTFIRKDMAKMISNFAINVLGKNVSTGADCTFLDTASLSEEAQYYIMTVCRLYLMGYESDGITIKKNFYPNQKVDRGQFGTILSRLLRGNENNGGDIYYEKHLAALEKEGIMTKIDTPFVNELKGRVMVMMQRIFEKKY